MLFYVGTYAEDQAPGIYLCQLDLASGVLAVVDQFVVGANPSFLALHSTGHFLYTVNEQRNRSGNAGGGISAFAIAPVTGRLTLLNRKSSHGADPCHVTVDRAGHHLLVANYTSGTLAVFPIAADGSLTDASEVVQHQGKGADPKRQSGPHAHAIYLDPAERFALACDLGIDRIRIYRFDPGPGKLHFHAEVDLPPGAGPRHLAFHPNGSWVYVINELNSTLTVFAYDATAGTLTELQTLATLPPDFTGASTTAEVLVHPSGKFVYGSNRGHDSMAMFAVDGATGRLTLIGHEPTRGQSPRHLVIDPAGTILLAAHQFGNSITSFRIEPQTGTLQFRHRLELPQPVCVVAWEGREA